MTGTEGSGTAHHEATTIEELVKVVVVVVVVVARHYDRRDSLATETMAGALLSCGEAGYNHPSFPLEQDYASPPPQRDRNEENNNKVAEEEGRFRHQRTYHREECRCLPRRFVPSFRGGLRR